MFTAQSKAGKVFTHTWRRLFSRERLAHAAQHLQKTAKEKQLPRKHCQKKIP